MRRYRPYLPYLRDARAPLFGALACGIIYGLANGAGLPVMFEYVFPQIFSEDAEVLSTMELVLVALWLPFIFIIRGLSGFLNTYLIQLCGVRVLEALRFDYFSKLQRLPLSFLQSQSSGDLMSRGLADTNQLQFALTSAANGLLKHPTTLIGALGALIWLAFREQGVVLVLVCLAIIPLCVLPIRFVGRKLVKRAEQVQHQLGSVTNVFAENLSAAREVRAFGLEEREGKRFSLISRALIRSQMKVVKYSQALAPAIEIISAVGISITLVYAYRVNVPLPTFLAIITALYASYDPIKKLGVLNSDLKRGEAALHRLEVVLNEPESITDPVQPVEVNRLRGEVSFENVTFSYKADAPALRGISAVIPAGTTCALVGPSGAGKSSFANLVPRFYDPDAGRILIDGIDVRSMRLADLRRNVAIVSQEPVLFNDSIYENLLLGRANASREEVEQAARNAFAHDFIMAMPHGYETLVGERGAALSGGQRQRLALARAFLRDAPVLILDEATSALDSESEAVIQEALTRLVAGRTVLIIAHRFSTIRDASLLLVFDRGEIVARGTHPDLYASNPLYRALYDRQRAPDVHPV